jgi:hypothetical protein
VVGVPLNEYRKTKNNFTSTQVISPHSPGISFSHNPLPKQKKMMPFAMLLPEANYVFNQLSPTTQTPS